LTQARDSDSIRLAHTACSARGSQPRGADLQKPPRCATAGGFVTNQRSLQRLFGFAIPGTRRGVHEPWCPVLKVVQPPGRPSRESQFDPDLPSTVHRSIRNDDVVLVLRPGQEPLLDQFVGSGLQRFRDGEAEHFGGLQVDDQLNFCRLLYRKVGRPLTLQNSAGVDAN
jgi:hypothetical protein